MQTGKFGNVATGTWCSIHSYMVDESLADVMKDGYFNHCFHVLRLHDRILLNGAELEVISTEGLTICTRLLKTVADGEGVSVGKKPRGRPPKSAQAA